MRCTVNCEQEHTRDMQKSAANRVESNMDKRMRNWIAREEAHGPNTYARAHWMREMSMGCACVGIWHCDLDIRSFFRYFSIATVLLKCRNCCQINSWRIDFSLITETRPNPTDSSSSSSCILMFSLNSSNFSFPMLIHASPNRCRCWLERFYQMT